MSSNSMTRSTLPLAVAAGLALAVALVASPLLVVAIIVTPFCLVWCGRGLPDSERRLLIAMLAAAIAVRAVVVAAQMLQGLPSLNDLSVGALAGDESYYLSRAIRVRDVLLGYGATSYDFFVINDEYGQTSYLAAMSWLQLVFGPTPYSLKVINGIIYVLGAALLFRVSRAAFGTLPSFTGLVVLLFLPSLLFSSVSLLKESSYFFASAVLVTAAWHAVRRARLHEWAAAARWASMIVATLVVLDGLRRGGLLLMGGGMLIGLAIWLVAQSRTRLVAAALACVLAFGAVFTVPALHDRFLRGVETAAKLHAGHVFTIGHVYKLMDDGFYYTPQAAPQWQLRFDDGQAIRFIGRALLSFLVTPWPWEMRSFGELALLPEHALWYLIVGLLAVGIPVAWRLDAVATSLFLGFALSTATVVALTNGNVGTLFRLRGLVTPYLVWTSAAGLCAIGERAVARAARPPLGAPRPAL